MQDITEKKHRKLLANNRHLRYMWIPYTDTVVVVTNNPIAEVKMSPGLPIDCANSYSGNLPGRRLYMTLMCLRLLSHLGH